MSDDWFPVEQVQPTPAKKLGHRRPWWDFNFIPLFLALFPLAYVRHLFNAPHFVIAICVVGIFLVWLGAGYYGRLSRTKKNEEDNIIKNSRSRINLRVITVAFSIIIIFMVSISVLAFYLPGGFQVHRLLLHIVRFDHAALPIFIVATFGFAIFYSRSHQRAKGIRYARWGFGGLMLASVASVFLHCLDFLPLSRTIPRSSILLLYWITLVVAVLLYAVSLALLINAILVHREDN